MFNLKSLCDDYVIHVSLFIVNLRIFFLYFLKTQNEHVNLFVDDGKSQIQYLIISKLKKKMHKIHWSLIINCMSHIGI
jgi:hypothetical protein